MQIKSGFKWWSSLLTDLVCNHLGKQSGLCFFSSSASLLLSFIWSELVEGDSKSGSTSLDRQHPHNWEQIRRYLLALLTEYLELPFEIFVLDVVFTSFCFASFELSMISSSPKKGKELKVELLFKDCLFQSEPTFLSYLHQSILFF